MTIPSSLQALVDSLDRLASAAPEQIEYLTALGVAGLADDLALEFDDLYRPRAELLEEVSAQAAAACRENDRMLSSDQLGWTFADLESAEWAIVGERIQVPVSIVDAIYEYTAGLIDEEFMPPDLRSFARPEGGQV